MIEIRLRARVYVEFLNFYSENPYYKRTQSYLLPGHGHTRIG